MEKEEILFEEKEERSKEESNKKETDEKDQEETTEEVLFGESEELLKEKEKRLERSWLRKGFDFFKKIIMFVFEKASMLFERIIFGKPTQSLSNLDFMSDKKTKEKKETKTKEKEETKTKEKETDEKDRKERSEESREEDRKARDIEACKILAFEPVREEFLNLGITAFPEQGQDCILLAMRNEKYQNVLFGSMQKTDLIKGKADHLAASLYEKCLQDAKGTEDIQKLKLDAAVDAAVCIANIRKRSYAPEDLSKQKQIASVYVELPHGTAEIKIKNHPDFPEKAQILFNGDKICDCEWEAMRQDETKNALHDNIQFEFEQAEKMRHYIGNRTDKSFQGFEFFQRKDGKTAVIYKEDGEIKKLGFYNFQGKKDVVRLSKKIEETLGYVATGTGQLIQRDFNLWINKEGTPVSGRTLAYTIAALSNPSMEQDIRNGEYYNTFTSKYEPGGAAHIQVSHDAHGVTFSQCIPEAKDSGYQMKVEKIKEYQNLSNLDTKDLNELTARLQKAFRENEKIKDVIPDHIRIQEVIHSSSILSDDRAKEILLQNALDERAQNFADLSSPEKDTKTQDINKDLTEPGSSSRSPETKKDSPTRKIEPEIVVTPVFNDPNFEVPGDSEEPPAILPDDEPER